MKLLLAFGILLVLLLGCAEQQLPSQPQQIIVSEPSATPSAQAQPDEYAALSTDDDVFTALDEGADYI